MGTQIKIIKLNRSNNKVTITLSNLEKPLIVSENTVYRYKLVDGIVITPSQFDILKHESLLFQCHREVTRLIALREHSTGEIRTKLKQKGFESEIIKETVKKFESRGLLNDAQFALNLAQRIINDKPCGKPYLTASLQRKMIDRELVEETIENVLANQDEIDLAHKALKKRWHEFSQFELEVARKKSYNYLARRSFGYEAVKNAFELLINRKEEDRKN
ncbi:MAG: regulatory protein RecX [Candidatus Zixiibacteriota bacterium]